MLVIILGVNVTVTTLLDGKRCRFMVCSANSGDKISTTGSAAPHNVSKYSCFCSKFNVLPPARASDQDIIRVTVNSNAERLIARLDTEAATQNNVLTEK